MPMKAVRLMASRWLRARVPARAAVVVAFLLVAAPALATGPELPLPLIRQDGSELLPDYVFEVRAANGRSVERGFIEYRGVPVVAVAWATWCGVCRGEMPKLDRLAQALAPEGVLVMALSIDDGGLAVADRALRERGLPHLRSAHDTKKMFFASIGAWGVPTTVIADAQGRIVARANGPVDWEARAVREFLRSLAPPRIESAQALR